MGGQPARGAWARRCRLVLRMRSAPRQQTRSARETAGASVRAVRRPAVLSGPCTPLCAMKSPVALKVPPP